MRAYNIIKSHNSRKVIPVYCLDNNYTANIVP